MSDARPRLLQPAKVYEARCADADPRLDAGGQRSGRLSMQTRPTKACSLHASSMAVAKKDFRACGAIGVRTVRNALRSLTPTGSVGVRSIYVPMLAEQW